MCATVNEDPRTKKKLIEEIDQLRARLDDAEQTLDAIRSGEVDALVVTGPHGDHIYSLTGAEQTYRLIVETMNEAALTLSLDGTILFCNQRFCNLMKISMPDTLGQKLTAFVAPAQQQPLRWFLADAQAGPIQQRLVLRAADGAAVSVQLAASLLVGEAHTDICLVASDLTELEAQAHSIKVLREQQQSLEEARAELAVANTSLSNSRLAALNVAEDAVAARRQAEEANEELRREVAERKQAEEAFRESEERFRALVTASSNVVYRMSPDWSEMRQLRGNNFIADTEKSNRNWLQEYIHPDDQSHVKAVINEAVRTKSIFELEHRVLQVDGTLGWTFSRAIPVMDADGEIVEWFGAASDVTERKRAEEELKQLNGELEKRVGERTTELREKDQMLLLQSRQAAMGEMIGNIAHQWRQPLNTLGLIVQDLPDSLEMGELTKENLDASVAKASMVIHHMSQTIDDFRNFFRDDKEKVFFKVSDIVEKAISLIDGSLREQRILVEVSAEEDITIHGYPNEYSQVILNILLNARDVFAERKKDEPRIVLIRLFKENGKAIATITDNAGGIAEGILPKIFDPYFTTKGPDKGTGVGLFMAKSIIEKNMGGRLSACNAGNGAEFRIEV